MSLRRLWLGIKLALIFLLAVVLIAPEWPAFGDRSFQIQAIVGQDRHFDFLVWTAEALGVKAEAVLADAQSYLDDETEQDFLLTYLSAIRAAQALEGEIERIYTDPTIGDPAAAAAATQAELDDLRRELAARQSLAEAIMQRQVGQLLREQGLAVGGLTFPPVLMTMSPVPYMLIVSPRDRIEQIDYAALVPGLSTESKEEIEDAIYDRLGLSALVVPIGGLGTYPAMIRETSSVNWLAEVTAHEWTHHWLAFRPLGVRYLGSPQLRTMNETVASIVDLEVGPEVIERFYPDYAVRETPTNPPPIAPSDEPEADVFDFSAELAATRNEVDRLLALGQVDEAERYMEARRQVFVANGYPIRKLNQAYFAFYGGYAAEPGGAAGADPVGPMLREIRANSPSLRVFLERVGRLTSYDDLVALHADVVGATPEGLDPAATLTQPEN